MLHGFGVEVAELAHRQDLRHLDVVQLPPLFGQRGEQRRGLAHAGGDDDEVAVLQQTDGVLRESALALVEVLE